MRFGSMSRKTGVVVHSKDAVSTEISNTRKEKMQAKIMAGGLTISPVGLSALLQTEVMERMFSTNPDLFFSWIGIGTALSAVVGVGVSKLFLMDLKNERIWDNLSENPPHGFSGEVQKALKQSKKERVLISSFNIREKTDIDINSWRKKPAEPVADENATHTVQHYVFKEDSTYRMEQEIIPNEETIWDLSADALVEVYGVQEKTKLKELSHE